ncbi:MAG TPA: phosphoenolpyruvate carboxykinase (ATP) [Flavobacteriales bacterium]|nr:phosphoenolpyruvate carboxykinase (ATP) [Flavobacteriales bacterium]HMZ49155.1 phosphoenolpyruvate carboxykinase (ATP) [Flavobacteriales bacterium]HNI03792.1 phosphoenolpyruvate carboxykinase (ATP) [Flavobacteriales bacterium]HNM70780.1 phosphoenolpyruvate carboxykinase (ATP) [Flavobacteriales bacterium]HNO03964.1 phosphoenolpyruvate carboxykinase (ATP) [Flavobacteriales bacterium]
MNEFGTKPANADLSNIGLKHPGDVYWNLEPAELIEHAVQNGEGIFASSGALAVNTGEFTGRSPKDKFCVEDAKTKGTVWWGDINMPISAENFDRLHGKLTAYLTGRDVYVKDAYACADPTYKLNLRVVAELPYSALFSSNMFLRPTAAELGSFTPEWHIICAPGFMADGPADGIRQHNFAAIDFTRKMILIGGTGYTGEIKKGIFTVLNYVLPQERKVLSMHCSANIGKSGDTAVFFGLSGTGKTTLSADPDRLLIGDDEHGWSDKGVFNFEGGCYAKCIDLSREKEPQIWDAVKFGALLENVGFHGDTTQVDFADGGKTENTRVSYPIDFIGNIAEPSMGGHPKNIFFLTCDAYGVLPPISRLTPGQAMYWFISGYTAKVAGTEAGITEPKTVFSACFGAPFLPLHPTRYADMLGEKLKKHDVRVWLVNTGWSGGAYGTGERMKLKFTRAMITAALNGQLDKVAYKEHPVFGVSAPAECPNVPNEILDPRNTWKDKNAYDAQAEKLARAFNDNFNKYKEGASPEILAAAPKAAVKA